MAVIFALFSSIAWGAADFLGGTISRKRKPFAVLAVSQFFGLVGAILMAILFHDWGFSRGVVVNGVIAGVIGLAGLTLFYAALASGQMGIVSPIASIGVVVPVFMGLAHGENPSSLQLVGIAIAIVGIVFASGPELGGGADPKPVIYAFVSAIGFGTCTYFMALGGQSSPTMTIVVMRVTQVLIAATGLAFLRSLGGLVKSDLPMLASIGVLDASANILFAVSSTMGMLSLVSVLGSLFPVVTVLLAWFIHKERLIRIQYIGIAIAAIGVCAISAG